MPQANLRSRASEQRKHVLYAIFPQIQYLFLHSQSSYFHPAGWQHTKESVRRLYDPNKGGSFEVFNERPLRQEVVQYCKQDVELLPTLWEVYSSKLRRPDHGCWRLTVREATAERIKLSQSKKYDGQAGGRDSGPWDAYNIEQATEDWNNDVTLCAINSHLVLDEDDRWVASLQEGAQRSSVFTLAAVV